MLKISSVKSKDETTNGNNKPLYQKDNHESNVPENNHLTK